MSTAGSGYERQRIALAVIVLERVALETAGNRSKQKAAVGASGVLGSFLMWSGFDVLVT
jgi:hypothetical protein